MPADAEAQSKAAAVEAGETKGAAASTADGSKASATETKSSAAAAASSAEPSAEATTSSGTGGGQGAGDAASSVGGGELPPDVIDMDVFGQLLEMDDEEDREFSREIVWNYFDQAESTFGNMDKALADKNLPELSTLGHFLKGSSAAVGVIKVRDSCEAMQHYGKCADKDGVTELSQAEAIEKLQSTLDEVKVDYKEAEKHLKRFYEA